MSEAKKRELKKKLDERRSQYPEGITRKHVQDTSTSRCFCPECGAPICLGTNREGGLAAYDFTHYEFHRHQPPYPDREANRERVALGACAEGYGILLREKKGPR